MSDSRLLVYVGGVPGTGKTTIGLEVASRGSPGFNYISSGEIKGPESLRRFGKKLSSLDQEKSFEINRWFFEEILRNAPSGIYLVDTHYTYPIQNHSSFVRLFPEEYASLIDLFVLFETNPTSIFRRRIRRGRDRDSISLLQIQEEITEERDEAIRLTRKYSKPLILFDNGQEFGDSVSLFESALKSYLIY